MLDLVSSVCRVAYTASYRGENHMMIEVGADDVENDCR